MKVEGVRILSEYDRPYEIVLMISGKNFSGDTVTQVWREEIAQAAEGEDFRKALGDAFMVLGRRLKHCYGWELLSPRPPYRVQDE